MRAFEEAFPNLNFSKSFRVVSTIATMCERVKPTKVLKQYTVEGVVGTYRLEQWNHAPLYENGTKRNKNRPMETTFRRVIKILRLKSAIKINGHNRPYILLKYYFGQFFKVVFDIIPAVVSIHL